MRRLSIFAPVVFLIGTGSPADRPHTVLLFGARWCAPCMAEYGDLAALASAAAPDRLVLAWVDRRIAPPPALASRVDTLDAEQARQLAVRMAGEGFGLPFAAMLDADGGVCAVRRGALLPGHIAALRDRCQAAVQAP